VEKTKIAHVKNNKNIRSLGLVVVAKPETSKIRYFTGFIFYHCLYLFINVSLELNPLLLGEILTIGAPCAAL
jgi:hypothetical protein